MNEKRAREILGEWIQPDDRLFATGCGYIIWKPGGSTITLKSQFTLEDIEAIAWWMRHKDKR